MSAYSEVLVPHNCHDNDKKGPLYEVYCKVQLRQNYSINP